MSVSILYSGELVGFNRYITLAEEVQLRFLSEEIQNLISGSTPFPVTGKTLVSITESVPDYTFFAVSDGIHILVLIHYD